MAPEPVLRLLSGRRLIQQRPLVATRNHHKAPESDGAQGNRPGRKKHGSGCHQPATCPSLFPAGSPGWKAKIQPCQSAPPPSAPARAEVFRRWRLKSSAAQSPGALASDHGACPPPSPPRAPAGEGEDKSAKEGKRSDDDAKLSTLPRTGLTRSGRREQVGSVCARGRAGHFQGGEVSRETWAGGHPTCRIPWGWRWDMFTQRRTTDHPPNEREPPGPQSRRHLQGQ